jgi:bacteriorhodopsin
MVNEAVKLTGKYSLIAQLITGIVDVVALQVENKDLVLKQLLSLELAVQIIELVFYIWLVYHFPPNTKEEVTKYRYYDWALSTNIMLFTLIVYIIHLRYPDKTITEIYTENKKNIQSVLMLNTSMLIIGYMGEVKKLSINQSVYIGFIPFIIYYGIIYKSYVKNDLLPVVSDEKKREINLLFWYFFIVWSMYGVSAMFPYTEKNISYNILDIFSKNFFGLFLSWKVYKDKVN